MDLLAEPDDRRGRGIQVVIAQRCAPEPGVFRIFHCSNTRPAGNRPL